MKRAISCMARISVKGTHLSGPQCKVNLRALYSGQNISFIIDSGSTHDICHVKEAFINMKPDKTAVEVANGEIVYNEGIGTVGSIDNVYFIPGFGHNLLSVVQMNKRGYIVQFDWPLCTLINKKTREEQEIGQFVNGLYQSTHNMETCQANTSIRKIARHDLWHARCGHLCDKIITTAVRRGLVTGINIPLTSNKLQRGFCEGCVLAKQTRTSAASTPGSRHNVKHHHTKSSNEVKPIKQEIASMQEWSSPMRPAFSNPALTFLLPLTKMCMDLKGPIRASINRSKYAFICTCALTRYRFIFLLKTKDEVLQNMKQLMSAIKALGRQCRQVKFDNGGEFVNHDVSQYLLDEGIRQETTSPHSPHQNGIAERTNRTVCELTVAMMMTTKVPYYLWEYTMRTAVMLLNHFPCQALEMKSTPHLEVFGTPPLLSHLRIFGCDVYATIPEHEPQVLGPRSWKGLFVGYDHAPTSSSLAY